ncbi:myosin-9 [Drosophila kikkawai]|uniref:Myosin-9 n=1 Tax=Drosophila kikkawai TaxID=30033 RepID=A0A6P4J3I1_DROKI|nr:uncharacterized protein LOC108083940 [Drosophila kikkawai]
MADNPTEEVPPAAPADEVAAPADVVAAPPDEVAAPEEAPLPEAIRTEETAEILVENEIVEAIEEHLPAEGEEQPVEMVGEGEEQPLEDGQEPEVKATGPVTASERKRQKLEKIKKMLDQEKAAMREALEAAEAEAAKEAREEEEEGSHEIYHLLGSDEGAQSSDEFADLKAVLNELDDMEPTGSVGGEEEDAESVSSEDTPRPRLQKSIKGTFLREFESLPSISDISLDISFEEAEPIPDDQKKATEEKDEGHFVKGDAFDGEDESEGSSSDQNTANAGIAGVEEESESENSLIDDIPDDQEVTEKRVVIKEEEDDTMAMFTDALEAVPSDFVENVVVAEEPFWYRLTADFVENLIATVVEKLEKAALSEQTLDKNKMLWRLAEDVDNYLYEHCLNTQINGIISEYFRRNHKKSPFLVLTPEDAAKERLRFHQALNVVDSLRERVKLMKINYGTNTHKAMIELSSLTVLSFNEEQRLEGLMRRTLVRRDMERLRRILDNELRRMQDMRNQVSEKRYELNLNLHNLAFVDQKVAKFEMITDTLTISQMLCANESIIHLGKQLEEKSKDVLFMQSNYKKSMIEETCAREKRDMISYSLAKAKLKYDERLKRRNQLREELTKLQWEHAQLKAQRARLEVKGGLLFKVSLMYDYDKCMDFVEEKRKSVKKLKALNAEMSKRVVIMEKDIRASSKAVVHIY